MTQLEKIQTKIYSGEELRSLLNLLKVWRFKEEKTVFTNGCFDILHPGHVTYLAKAADLGKRLIIGLNSDASVRLLNKGENRPIQDQQSRAMILAALHFVDAVIIFEEETPYEMIKAIQPDVLVKGGDWKTEDIVGSDIVLKKGGTVQSIDFLPGYSTTGIENKIRDC